MWHECGKNAQPPWLLAVCSLVTCLIQYQSLPKPLSLHHKDSLYFVTKHIHRHHRTHLLRIWHQHALRSNNTVASAFLLPPCTSHTINLHSAEPFNRQNTQKIAGVAVFPDLYQLLQLAEQPSSRAVPCVGSIRGGSLHPSCCLIASAMPLAEVYYRICQINQVPSHLRCW